jgi:hypothetical protein
VQALALDPLTGDLLTAGGLSLVEGVDAVAQRLRGRIRFWRGEWFADTSIGIPYGAIFAQKGGERVAEAALRSAITTCPGVGQLLDFTQTLDRATRHASVRFRARTVDGVTLSVVSDRDGFRWERAS